jgi:hypothetical protein
MPDKNFGGLTPLMQIATYTSGSTYAINSGTVVAAGAVVAAAAITFTGLATTDGNIGIAPRDAAEVPKGLKLVSAVVTANTVTVTWQNITDQPITPPAASTWTATVFKPFLRVN